MGHYGTRVVRDSVALQIVDDKTRSDWNIQIKVTHQRIAFRTSLIRDVFAVNQRCGLADCLFGSPRQVRHIIAHLTRYRRAETGADTGNLYP